jgi:hypothetical protein
MRPLWPPHMAKPLGMRRSTSSRLTRQSDVYFHNARAQMKSLNVPGNYFGQSVHPRGSTVTRGCGPCVRQNRACRALGALSITPVPQYQIYTCGTVELHLRMLLGCKPPVFNISHSGYKRRQYDLAVIAPTKWLGKLPKYLSWS